MSKYTLQLRWYVENGGDLFDFDYPIFDEDYRGILEQKFIDHYYFREIGLETIGQFKHFLKSKLNIIMPYYNQLYETEGLVDKDNYNINLDNTITQTRKTDQSGNEGTDFNSDSTSNRNTNATGERNGTTQDIQNGSDQSIFSDTPQGLLDEGLDYATEITDSKHQNDNNRTENETTTQSGDESGTDNTVGNSKTNRSMITLDEYQEKLLGNGSMRYNADILMEWRKSFLNIDQQIIEECNDLFMNIY